MVQTKEILISVVVGIIMTRAVKGKRAHSTEDPNYVDLRSPDTVVTYKNLTADLNIDHVDPEDSNNEETTIKTPKPTEQVIIYKKTNEKNRNLNVTYKKMTPITVKYPKEAVSSIIIRTTEKNVRSTEEIYLDETTSTSKSTRTTREVEMTTHSTTSEKSSTEKVGSQDVGSVNILPEIHVKRKNSSSKNSSSLKDRLTSEESKDKKVFFFTKAPTTAGHEESDDNEKKTSSDSNSGRFIIEDLDPESDNTTLESPNAGIITYEKLNPETTKPPEDSDVTIQDLVFKKKIKKRPSTEKSPMDIETFKHTKSTENYKNAMNKEQEHVEGRVYSDGKNSYHHHMTVPTRQLTKEDLFIAVRTTQNHEESRLPLIIKTWFPIVRDETYFFTDGFKQDRQEDFLIANHIIWTDCNSTYSQENLCCKMEYALMFYNDLFKDVHEIHQASWWCHFDDDNYVNIFNLLQVLSSYRLEKNWYLGRQYTANYDPKGKYLIFAERGAGICLNRKLVLELLPHIRDGQFYEVCSKNDIRDDEALGYLIREKVNGTLTNIPEFQGDVGDLSKIPTRDLKEQVTLGYKLELNKIIKVPGFPIEEDPTRLLSLHCYLCPTVEYCKNITTTIRTKRDKSIEIFSKPHSNRTDSIELEIVSFEKENSISKKIRKLTMFQQFRIRNKLFLPWLAGDESES